MKTVLLTGATGAIGCETIKVLDKAGYRIAAQYNTNDILVEQLSQEFHKVKFYKADLLDIIERRKFVEAVFLDFTNIDILINNAGAIYGAENFLNVKEDNFDNTFNINFKAHFFITQSVYKIMIEKKTAGRIINISSISAKYGGGENTLHYGCAKAAIECFTKGLAKSAAKNNILVNCVQLGFVESEFHFKMGRTEEELKKRIDLIPLKRAGKPRDAADMIEFLCSEKSSFITGQIFTVSGGD